MQTSKIFKFCQKLCLEIWCVTFTSGPVKFVLCDLFTSFKNKHMAAGV